MKTKVKKKKNGVVPSTVTTKVPKKPKIDYEGIWQGMPEFNQPGIEPVKVLLVNFQTKEDMLKFSKLVGFQITAKTKSIWFPVVEETPRFDKRWSDKKK